MSVDNLANLASITLPSGQLLRFVLAIAERGYIDFVQLLQHLHDASTDVKTTADAPLVVPRVIVAHDTVRAHEQTSLRVKRSSKLRSRGEQPAGELEAPQARQFNCGRKLSGAGAKACFFHERADAHLSKIIKVVLVFDLFAYDIDEVGLQRAQMLDGKLLLVTNVADLVAAEIVHRFTSLSDIQRGFKVRRSEIEIAPGFYRLLDRIRAHASICFMAVILYAVIRQCLKFAGHADSPDSGLAQLRRIQRRSVSIN